MLEIFLNKILESHTNLITPGLYGGQAKDEFQSTNKAEKHRRMNIAPRFACPYQPIVSH